MTNVVKFKAKSVLRHVRSAQAAERKMVRDIAQAAGKEPNKFRDAAKKLFTTDSFQNFALGLGIQADNALAQSTYGYNPVTRIRVLLEWIHRGAWLGGQAVDVVADDMTRAGIDVNSVMAPDDVELLQKALVRKGIWSSLNEVCRWARLYGGCIGVMMIDGQQPETELRLETIDSDQFHGVLALDRWLVNPTLNDLVFSPEWGMVPRYYEIPAGTMGLPHMKFHHSRVLRMEGVRLPYQQRLTEMLWGLSVFERLYDIMIAFDSATTGAAQLVYKSYLRYVKIADLKKIVAEGGPAMNGLVKYVDMMRRYQGIEGVTMIDATDDFAVQQHQGFSGISDVLMQFGQQLAGALQIPLVRLFGQSPAGLNSSGESDLRNYYDGIRAQQEKMRVPLERIIRVVAKSEKIKLPDNFSFDFRPLWQLTDEQKANVAKTNTDTISSAFAAGLISDAALALKELRQQSRITGVWANITDEDIEDAKNAAPPNMGEVPGLSEGGGQQLGEEPIAAEEPGDAQEAAAGTQEPQAGKPAPERDGARTRDGVEPWRRTVDFHGLPVVLERLQGEEWHPGVKLPADYGYIRGTGSAEGPDEEMDIFLAGPLPTLHVVDSYHPDGTFDEHKLVAGVASPEDASACFGQAYSDSKVAGAVTPLPLSDVQKWLQEGDLSRPFSETYRRGDE